MRRVRKKRLILVIIVFLLLIFGIVGGIYFMKDEEVTTTVKEEATEETTEDKLKEEKYYIEDNLERYLAYYEENIDLTLSEIVRNVNCNLDKTWYEDVSETDTSKGNLMLVNKYYYLTEDFVPDNLVTLSSEYNIGLNSQMTQEAANAFMEMSDAALLDGIIIKNASGYRSYQYQVNLYNNYVERDGKDAADTYSARAGYSEHQTGLVSDINEIDDSFEETDAFTWLSNNAYKYGFILRFPKDKEDITGYKYESWHYRYVGVDAAKVIYEEDLTLEEYYAYYVN